MRDFTIVSSTCFICKSLRLPTIKSWYLYTYCKEEYDQIIPRLETQGQNV